MFRVCNFDAIMKFTQKKQPRIDIEIENFPNLTEPAITKIWEATGPKSIYARPVDHGWMAP
jgi:hypothetical protein